MPHYTCQPAVIIDNGSGHVKANLLLSCACRVLSFNVLAGRSCWRRSTPMCFPCRRWQAKARCNDARQIALRKPCQQFASCAKYGNGNSTMFNPCWRALSTLAVFESRSVHWVQVATTRNITLVKRPWASAGSCVYHTPTGPQLP